MDLLFVVNLHLISEGCRFLDSLFDINFVSLSGVEALRKTKNLNFSVTSMLFKGF